MVAFAGDTPQVRDVPAPSPDGPLADVARVRHIGVVPTASMLTGAAVGIVWVWIPLAIVIIGISSIPSIVGFVAAAIVFVYVMRGVEWVERIRSEAVFALGIPTPARKRSPHQGFKGWAHQLILDAGSVRFWKSTGHHFLRLTFDILAAVTAMVLLVFAILCPIAAISVSRSDPAVGVRFISPPLACALAVVALVVAVAIAVFAPAVDALIDRWLLSPSTTAALQDEVSALSDARRGAVSSAYTERHRIERDLHDGVQPRLVSLAMTIGLAQTKLDTDLPEAKKLIGEAHDEIKDALLELRNVVRGIAPTILADRGLDAALSSVVQRSETSGVPTTMNIDLARRLSDEVESVAYFVVAEALTNVAKHARAGHAVVTVRFDGSSNSLYVSVFDDGVGGASVDVDDATGLRGLGERVRAARGTFEVISPATGSTIVAAVLPCGS